MSRAALLLLLLAAAAAIGFVVLRGGGGDDEVPTSTVAREAPDEAPPPDPVVLKGRSDARPARTEPPPAAPSDEATPAVVEPRVMSGGRVMTEVDFRELQRREALEAPRVPERPGRPDLALGDPWRSPRYGRVDLLGRRVDGEGPWLPDGRGLSFTGMAQVDHEDAGAAVEEEIEEPLVTAVKGRILTDGDPVAGAEVILYSTFYQRHARYDHHVREVGRTVTDGYGVFDLRPIGLDTVHFGSNGEVLLTVHRAGFGSIVAKRLDNLQPEVENDLGAFDLQPVSPVLYGVIRDLAGRPVPGAVVRVSGSVNPVLYDKTERMIILKDCPAAVADDEGRYRLEGFAAGTQHVSVHVNIDCVLHFDATYAPGEHEWSPRVLAGNSVRGRVVDAEGVGIAAAVVSGGGNWTPTGADGTFWLDNIQPGPFPVLVAHHLFHSVHVPQVAAGTEDLEIVMDAPLPRVQVLVATEESSEPVPLIAIDWLWARGAPPPFAPVSRFWNAADGRYDVVVPEGAVGARLSATGRVTVDLGQEALEDGRVIELALPLEE